MEYTQACFQKRVTVQRSVLLIVTFMALHQLCAAQSCGKGANKTLCEDGLCCSQYGFCGTTSDYCGTGCQSQCASAASAVTKSKLGNTVSNELFDALFPNRSSFYTYDAFISAGKAFPVFGSQGNEECRLREIAAFAAHVQQETAGLVYISEIDKSGNYCDPTNLQYPCAANQSYYGRGPLQLSWNYNYGAAGAAIGEDILAMPNEVEMDPVVAFKTSLWFWTTATSPSIHDVLTGQYVPTQADLDGNREPGFGLTILIINGAIECGKATPQAANRVKYFKQFCAQLGVDPGPYLTCANMTPFGS